MKKTTVYELICWGIFFAPNAIDRNIAKSTKEKSGINMKLFLSDIVSAVSYVRWI